MTGFRKLWNRIAKWAAFGRGAADTILQSETASVDAAYRAAGTLADWKSNVAALAVGNDRLALFVSAAFAGPLLDVMGGPSGGVHLVGKSRTGKSTAVVVAANVWGRLSGGMSGGVREGPAEVPEDVRPVGARGSPRPAHWHESNPGHRVAAWFLRAARVRGAACHRNNRCERPRLVTVRRQIFHARSDG